MIDIVKLYLDNIQIVYALVVVGGVGYIIGQARSYGTSWHEMFHRMKFELQWKSENMIDHFIEFCEKLNTSIKTHHRIWFAVAVSIMCAVVLYYTHEAVIHFKNIVYGETAYVVLDVSLASMYIGLIVVSIVKEFKKTKKIKVANA